MIADGRTRAAAAGSYLLIAQYHNAFAADVIRAAVGLAEADTDAAQRRDRG